MKKFAKLYGILFLVFLSLGTFAQPSKAITYDWFQEYGGQEIPVVFDTDYQAVLDRATALGYTKPSAAQQIKQNQYVLDLKSAGIWTLLDILYVFATDGDSDYGTLNWKAPTLFQCTKVNSPTFTTNQGFNGNGTTSYLNTNWNANTNGVNYTLNSCGFYGYVNSDIALSASTVFGCVSGTGVNTSINPRNAANAFSYAINSNSSSTNTSLNSIGLWHVYRTASNVEKTYKNGVLAQSGVTVSSSIPSLSVYISVSNNAGVPSAFSTRKISFYGAGGSLTTKELSFYNAWNTYFTSL